METGPLHWYKSMSEQTWHIGDCLDLLPEIPDKSIDMILTDLPYGTTACSWDTVIPFEPLWEQYKRIIKYNGAIVLTASQPFTSALIMSNIEMFKYEWIWEKEQGTNFQLVQYQPLKTHESILVFSSGVTLYNPQNMSKCRIKKSNKFKGGNLKHCASEDKRIRYTQTQHNYPKSILYFNRNVGIHPTQKPLALFEYLIKTYTNEGDTVHDSCLGSGTTLEACMNTNRNCIGFEISDEWIPHYKKRLKSDNSKLMDFL